MLWIAVCARIWNRRVVVRSDSCADTGSGLTTTRLEFLQREENPRQWYVELGLTVEEDEQRGCPAYSLDLQVVGVFTVVDTYPAAKREGMVRVNAPALLYGAAREMVAHVTGRGPYQPVVLPAVTFIDEAAPVDNS